MSETKFVTMTVAGYVARDEEQRAWKAWRRALVASRRAVVKVMESLGYSSNCYTKRPGRDIKIVRGSGETFDGILRGVVSKMNAKWAGRLMHNGTQWFIGMSPVRYADPAMKPYEGVCLTTEFTR